MNAVSLSFQELLTTLLPVQDNDDVLHQKSLSLYFGNGLQQRLSRGDYILYEQAVLTFFVDAFYQFLSSVALCLLPFDDERCSALQRHSRSHRKRCIRHPAE